MKTIISSIFTFVLISYLVVEFKYSQLEFKGFEAYNKLWIHRGGSPENTIEGISQSLRNGFSGIETDLQYDEKNNLLLVGHDEINDGDVPLPKLETYLEHFKTIENQWWFDLKNLDQENAGKIIKIFKQLENKFELTGKYFIESDQYIALNTLAKEDLPTVYWINPHTKSRLFFLRSLENKIKLIFSNFLGISIYYDSYNDRARSYLGKIPKFIFTVNGNKKNSFLQDKTVHVVLTDDL